MNAPDPATRKPAVWNREKLPHVRRLLAIASGKGGVGKSTVTVTLAFALHAIGLRVGLLDADIYGPSLPRMLGLSGKPEQADGMMQPLMAADAVPCMSIGFIMPDQAAVLRGPMVSKALAQLARGTRWADAARPLDALLVDMPPGTGDIHLSLAQQVPIDHALIVTTPQAVATADAAKAMEMFEKLNVPLIGVLENMSYFQDPATGTAHRLFGNGGGEALAQTHRVHFLGALPLLPALGAALDNGDFPSHLSLIPSALHEAAQVIAKALVE